MFIPAAMPGRRACLPHHYNAPRQVSPSQIQHHHRRGPKHPTHHAEQDSRAVEKEDADGQAHTVLGNVRLLQGRYDEALAVATESIFIRPGCTMANGFLGRNIGFQEKFRINRSLSSI